MTPFIDKWYTLWRDSVYLCVFPIWKSVYYLPYDVIAVNRSSRGIPITQVNRSLTLSIKPKEDGITTFSDDSLRSSGFSDHFIISLGV